MQSNGSIISQRVAIVACCTAILCPQAAAAADALEHTSWLIYWGTIILWGLSLWGVALWVHKRSQATRCREIETAIADRDASVHSAEKIAEQYRSLFDLAQVGIFRSRLDGSSFFIANRACAAMHGYDDVEAFVRDVAPRDVYADPAVRDAMLDVLRKNNHVDNLEVEVLHRDGTPLQVLLNITMYEKEGYIQGAVMDVTEFKEAERLLRGSHTFLQDILNALPTPVFFKDAEARYQLINSAFVEMMGHTPDELLGKSVYDIAPKHLADKYHEMDKALLESRGPAIQQYEYSVAADSGMRDVVFNKESMFDEAGNILGLVGVIMDITDRKKIENSLRRAEERYRALYMNAAEGIFTAAMDKRFVGVNPAMARMFGYDSPAAMAAQVEDIGAQLFEDAEQFDLLVKRLRDEMIVTGFEVKGIRREGERFWVSISARGITGIGGKLDRVEGLVVDISAQKRSEESLAKQVMTDPLTGIANRIGMNLQLEQMLDQASRSQCQIGLLFIDLDKFKPINDQYGHQVGDELLQQVAVRLSKRLRGSDLAARVGGDEFAILLWDVAGPAGMERVSRELFALLNEPFDCSSNLCSVGASMGGSLFPNHGKTMNELLSAADSAMYEAKRTGVDFCFAPLPKRSEVS